MKPLNLDNKPCSPVSSNCVVWQGPDIECINLCHGDSVSDVVHKLATELCTIMTTLKVSSYDLTCLGITAACPPKDFTALIQFLIARICELEKIENQPSTSASSGSSGCPDCVVTVAECFVVGTTTTMQLSDYVHVIANKVCDLIGEISIMQTQINNLDVRVTALENTPAPGLTLPSIPTDCLQSVIVGNPASTTIDVVLTALLSDSSKGFCQYIDKLGLPADIYGAINGVVCITSGTTADADPTLTMGSLYNGIADPKTWVGTPTTLVHTINNLWIAICDSHGKPTIEFTDTDTIKFTKISDRPAYNFSAEVVSPGEIMVKRSGVGITLSNADNGLKYVEPGFLMNPLTSLPSGSRNASRIDQLQQQNAAAGVITTVYDSFTASPFDATSGNITVPSDGIYDIGFRVHMTAAPPTGLTTAQEPNGPATAGYGMGKGFWGGTPVKSNDSAATLNLTATGGTGSGYTNGFARISVPGGDDVIVTITVNAVPDITSIIIVNGGSGITESLVGVDLAIIQAGSLGTGRVQITSLTKPTPTCTILAGMITTNPGNPSVNHCVDMFAANTGMPYADLSSSAMGIELSTGDVIQFRIGILTNDEDPAAPGSPNPIWDYTSATEDYIEWYFKKIGPTP